MVRHNKDFNAIGIGQMTDIVYEGQQQASIMVGDQNGQQPFERWGWLKRGDLSIIGFDEWSDMIGISMLLGSVKWLMSSIRDNSRPQSWLVIKKDNNPLSAGVGKTCSIWRKYLTWICQSKDLSPRHFYSCI